MTRSSFVAFAFLFAAPAHAEPPRVEFAGGESLTRPLRFAGDVLERNWATRAAGGIRVEIQDAQGKAIEGHTLADSVEMVGDDLARVVTWRRGAGVGKRAGRPVRLRFPLRAADLYALQFKDLARARGAQ